MAKDTKIQMVAINTLVRPHPKTKGAFQDVMPGTRFEARDETERDELLGMAAAKLYSRETAEPKNIDADEPSTPTKKAAPKKAAPKKASDDTSDDTSGNDVDNLAG
jgi:hypothetical protein